MTSALSGRGVLANAVARDMGCCDSGTSVSSILIHSFYYCIQHWLDASCLLHDWFRYPFLTLFGEDHLVVKLFFVFSAQNSGMVSLVFALWSSAASCDRVTMP